MPPELTGLLGGVGIITIVAVCGGILLTTALTIGITFFAIKMIRKAVGTNPTILQNGIPAKAKIISIQQTGVMFNYQPQAALQLEVYPPGGDPYTVQTKAIIPMVNIPQFQPGTEVPVKIHPSDPSQVALLAGTMM